MSNMKSIKEHARATHGGRSSTITAALALAIFAFACGQHTVQAAEREQAKRMFDRLTGTPPTPAQLAALEGALGSNPSHGQRTTVALNSILNSSDGKDFYSVTLKNFATPWTNRDQTVFAELNDYTATVIGMVRDDRDFRGLLSDDIVYVGNGISPAYSTTDNAHYIALESSNANLQSALVLRTQSSLNGLPPGATAGVMTSRAAAAAFFIDGTNRAMFRFTMLNHLCRDMEQVHDTTRPPDRIRQDVTRSPGGDSSVFLNNCVGCHNGMDPLAQAFAFYDFDETQGRLVYTQGVVQPKYLINSDNFKPGFVTPDDRWDNRWRLPGQNEAIGWDPARQGFGNGAKTMGDELAHSAAFAECQVEKVFRSICFRSPSQGDDSQFQSTTAGFQSTGNLKRVFAEVAAHCAGE
jgi:hypothetical protein